MKEQITYEDFDKVDIRVGRITEVTDFERARFPSYKFKIDFGPEIGVKQSSGRYKVDYAPEDLLGRQCLAARSSDGRFFDFSLRVEVECGASQCTAGVQPGTWSSIKRLYRDPRPATAD